MKDEREIKIERRYAILQVSPEFLVEFCKGLTVKRILIEDNALPADAQIVGVGPVHPMRQTHVFDAPFGVVGIIIRSETFEDVPLGTQIPILPPTKFKMIEEAPQGFESSKCPSCGNISVVREGEEVFCNSCSWRKKK